MLGLIRLLPPCFFPPALSGGGVRESMRSARKAVHDSPPSSEANLRWQNQSHISRRTEEGSFRGAFESVANKRYPRVTSKRREETLSAFCVFRLFPQGFPLILPWHRALRFGRERSGSERNLQGSPRSPKSLAKTLGISDYRPQRSYHARLSRSSLWNYELALTLLRMYRYNGRGWEAIAGTPAWMVRVESRFLRSPTVPNRPVPVSRVATREKPFRHPDRLPQSPVGQSPQFRSEACPGGRSGRNQAVVPRHLRRRNTA
jgi:hypothetical protein